MAKTIGDYGRSGLTIGDPELLFDVEDERWRESYRQLIENIQILLGRVEVLEDEVSKLKVG